MSVEYPNRIHAVGRIEIVDSDTARLYGAEGIAEASNLGSGQWRLTLDQPLNPSSRGVVVTPATHEGAADLTVVEDVDSGDSPEDQAQFVYINIFDVDGAGINTDLSFVILRLNENMSARDIPLET